MSMCPRAPTTLARPSTFGRGPKRLAGMGVFALVLTAVAGGVAVVVGQVAPEPPPAGLIRAVWIAESFILAICLLDLDSCCCFFWAATS